MACRAYKTFLVTAQLLLSDTSSNMAGLVAKTAANVLLKKQMKEYSKKEAGNKYVR